jgi:hypothetical protein
MCAFEIKLGGKSGKSPFGQFTKSALVDIIEEMVATDRERSKPMHKRGEVKAPEKDDATRDADDARDSTADLVEESRGSAPEMPVGEEDFSDEAEGLLEDAAEKASKDKKKKKPPAK